MIRIGLFTRLPESKNHPCHHQPLGSFHIAISYVSMGEVYEGAFSFAHPHEHMTRFRQFLRPFQLLSLTDPIMERFGEIRSYLRRRGELISDFDMLLGATALQYDLTVLIENKRHFNRIRDLKLYQAS